MPSPETSSESKEVSRRSKFRHFLSSLKNYKDAAIVMATVVIPPLAFYLLGQDNPEMLKMIPRVITAEAVALVAAVPLAYWTYHSTNRS